MSDFLRFVVEQTLQGKSDQLKQTVIGVAVFGREPDYDPRVDPVVRVEARRLRAKLQEYYAGSGAADPIRIELPKGAYQPQFVRTPDTPVPEAHSTQPQPGPWIPTPVVLAIAVTVVGVMLFFFKRHPPIPASPPRLLTDRQAYSRSPRFSPDGNRIVFSQESSGSASHILIAPAAGGEPVPFTSGAVRDYFPEWSPDGRRIAFFREIDALTYSILLRDSAEQPLLTGVNEPGPIAFSRDGQTLYFADRPDPAAPSAIYSVSLHSGQRQAVSNPPAGILGDAYPQVSPDGSTIAFLRRIEAGVQDIYTQPLHRGAPRQISREQADFQGICWTADGHGILAAFARGESVPSLWRFSTDTPAEPARVAEAGIGPLSPAVSPTGNRLAFVVRIADTNIWRAIPQPAAESRQLTSSAALDTSPQISPDGKQMVWRSASTGPNEIWIASAIDGSGARRLTSMRGPVTGSPRWSPDGKHIVFESRRNARGSLFTLHTESGASPRELTHGQSNDILPSWSHNNRDVYFASDRSGQWQVWRMSSDGQAPQQITQNGGFAAFESYDGKTVYYSKQSGGIWKTSRNGGAETLVTSDLAPNYWGQFALAERALYFVTFSASERAIRRLDLATGEVRDARSLTRMPVQWDSGMSVSRDETSVLWSQLDAGASDIYVVDGIH